MPIFEVKSPDGKTYEVNAPDGATQEQAIAYVQNNYQAPSALASLTDKIYDIGKNLDTSLSKRADYYNTASDAYQGGQQGLLRSTGQVLGNTVLGAGNDVLGAGAEIALSGLGAITPDIVKQAGSGLATYVSESAPGQYAKNLANSALSAYGDLEQSNPALARDISSAGNAVGFLGSLIPGEKAVSATARVAPDLAESTIQAAKTLTPNISVPRILPEVTKNAGEYLALAKKYDVPLALDDLTDSSFYKTLVSEGQNLPFSGSANRVGNQVEKINDGIAKSIGLEVGERFTPENMDKAFTKAGENFNKLTEGKEFPINPDALQSLSEIEDVVDKGGYGSQGRELFDKYKNDIIDSSSNGTLSGDRLSKLRAQYNGISRKSSNVDAKALSKDFENFLIDMIGEDAPDELRKAKYTYKNLIAIEPLAQKAQKDGLISPALLQNRVSKVYGRDFTRGRAGELGDLAKLGQIVKETVPNSGTSQRQLAKNILTGNAIASIPSFAVAGPIGVLGQAALTGAGIVANRAIQNKNFDQKLIENLVNKSAKRVSSDKSKLLKENK